MAGVGRCMSESDGHMSLLYRARNPKLVLRRESRLGDKTMTTATSVKTATADETPTFRRPSVILPVPTPSAGFQHVQAGVPDSRLTREATGLLREFSTPLLFNHSHRVFFWANELGRQTGETFDVEILFVCAAFHDLGLLKKFSSATDRFEVDSANAVREFLTNHNIPDPRIQVAWDAISLHTTPGIAAYKPLEQELLYNGVALDVLGDGYAKFPEDV